MNLSCGVPDSVWAGGDKGREEGGGNERNCPAGGSGGTQVIRSLSQGGGLLSTLSPVTAD